VFLMSAHNLAATEHMEAAPSQQSPHRDRVEGGGGVREVEVRAGEIGQAVSSGMCVCVYVCVCVGLRGSCSLVGLFCLYSRSLLPL
jgi:hypothetical protein